MSWGVSLPANLHRGKKVSGEASRSHQKFSFGKEEDGDVKCSSSEAFSKEWYVTKVPSSFKIL